MNDTVMLFPYERKSQPMKKRLGIVRRFSAIGLFLKVILSIKYPPEQDYLWYKGH